MTPQTPRMTSDWFTDPTARPDELRAALDRRERESARHAARITRRTADRRRN